MSPLAEVIVTVLVGLTMLIGLAAVFLPLLPDMLIIWIAALGYGFFVGWGEVGPWLFGLITLLGAIGAIAEIWVSGAGAKRAGASAWGILGGLALGAVGLVLFTPLGGVLGLLLGTFVVEAVRLRDPSQAAKAMLGMGLGYGASFGVRLILGMAMIGVWILWVVVEA